MVKDKKFVVCPVSKDSQHDERHRAPQFQDTINKYASSDPDQKCTLLIPLILCRGYFWAPTNSFLQRNHAVLLVVDLENKTLKVHDSQSSLLRAAYNHEDYFYQVFNTYDSLNDYETLGTQNDAFSCGYFAHGFLQVYLETGSGENCKNVKPNVFAYANKKKFLQAHGVNLTGEDLTSNPIDDLLGFEADGQNDYRSETDTDESQADNANTSGIPIPRSRRSSLQEFSLANELVDNCSNSASPSTVASFMIKVRS